MIQLIRMQITKNLTLPAFFQVSIRSGDEDEPPKGCTTKKGEKCRFPFTYLDVAYYGCPVDPVEPSERWCSTKTDCDGNHVFEGDNYGFCEDGCPQHNDLS